MTKRLHVAFNGTALLSPLTGVGQYAKSLAEGLAATGELDIEYFYAASWSRDIRTEPLRSISAVKEFIK